MKILTAAQIREADRQTIAEEQIASVELMERAALAFTSWFDKQFKLKNKTILVCCGPGNNGGDGLAIARLLHQKKYNVAIWVVAPEANYSPDFTINQKRLPTQIPVSVINISADIPALLNFDYIIDCLFGTGLSRPASGIFAEVIAQINKTAAKIIAIDIPSGLFAEHLNTGDDTIVHASHTVSFEVPKLAFLLPHNEAFVGDWHLVVIKLSPTYLQQAPTDKYLITPELLNSFQKKRGKYSHKGTYGHALLLAGSYGKMGAAVLASKASLRSGVGLLTIACPEIGYQILQTSVPEAMVIPDSEAHFLSVLPDLEIYQAIGIGPGLGKAPATRKLVRQLLQRATAPLVLDADVLNIIAEENLSELLPANSILTPHPKEFERLAGKAANDYEQLDRLQNFCSKYSCYVVLKGGHTCIGTPEGDLYFNNTGNPGMATGGTGDVLTGIITALVAQKYSPLEASLIGVYTHGLAGDFAKKEKGEMALIASDLIDNLGKAFSQNPQ